MSGGRLRRRFMALGFALGWTASPVFAACGVANAPVAISFGSYTPITFPGKIASTNVDSTGTVSVSCSGLVQPATYTLRLSAGGSNAINARAMSRAGAGSTMGYNLYVDAARTTVWGDGINGATFSGTVSPTDGTVNHTFYGRIPSGQFSVMPGSYSDQLVITLEYAL